MSKELVAMLALLLALVSAVFAGGIRIGTLTERIEAQSKQIDRLAEEARAINAHFIAWAGSHTEPAPARRPR